MGTIADTEMSMENNVVIATTKVVTPMPVASAMKHATPSTAIVVKITGSLATMILNSVLHQQQKMIQRTDQRKKRVVPTVCHKKNESNHQVHVTWQTISSQST